MGTERIRESRAQTFHLQYEKIYLKSGESIDNFGMRLSSLIYEFDTFDVKIDEKRAVLKFLCVGPRRYKQLAWSIESLVNLNPLTVDELIGRLKVVHDHKEDEDTGSKLLLTED